jgi:hypothetical protein
MTGIIKILAGMIIGGLIGYGANYLCMITGGACPIAANKTVIVTLGIMAGGLISASLAMK